MCLILLYVGNHIWDILQTLIGLVAIILAYKIGKRQINVSERYIKMTEYEKSVLKLESMLSETNDKELLDIINKELDENRSILLSIIKSSPLKK